MSSKYSVEGDNINAQYVKIWSSFGGSDTSLSHIEHLKLSSKSMNGTRILPQNTNFSCSVIV